MKKRIVCYGDSNTWGYDACTGGRFSEEIRWTAKLQAILGDRYAVVEEGLCGRTTVFDDPLNEGLNGLAYLLPCLMSHAPIDYLILMLGTNDCKERFSATPRNIADGMRRLILKAKQTPAWAGQPNILVVAPGPIGKECEQSLAAGEMGICSDTSRRLSEEYKTCARETGCGYFDAGSVVKMNRIDYMHFDAQSHVDLAEKLAALVIMSVEKTAESSFEV